MAAAAPLIARYGVIVWYPSGLAFTAMEIHLCLSDLGLAPRCCSGHLRRYRRRASRSSRRGAGAQTPGVRPRRAWLDRTERSYYCSPMAATKAYEAKRGGALRATAKGARTREAILSHALSLATRVGLEGLTIGRLADDLRISKSG